VLTTLRRAAGKYTVFGKVINGLEVLDAMEKVRAHARALAATMPVTSGKQPAC
jgi:cyclophilin family peptidyl-prolyl cis-trans isomerase